MHSAANEPRNSESESEDEDEDEDEVEELQLDDFEADLEIEHRARRTGKAKDSARRGGSLVSLQFSFAVGFGLTILPP